MASARMWPLFNDHILAGLAQAIARIFFSREVVVKESFRKWPELTNTWFSGRAIFAFNPLIQ